MDTFESLLKQSSSEINVAKTSTELHEIEIKYLGRNGQINELFKKMKDVPVEQKKEYGRLMNELKTKVETEIKSRQTLVSSATHFVYSDITAPGIKPLIGHLHPNTEVVRKINAFFRYLGYSVYEGPEIETDLFCFEKLNLPKDHPARELTDTLYIQQPELLLRVHTSSVEARALTLEKPPLRIVVPGRAYRNEAVNATNNAIFYQYEGLVVDKNISMGDLKGTLTEFAKFLYGNDVKTRFRCKYYPQVEPGAGFDIQCSFCGGKGCQVCKYRGFIEVLGAGMVHPNLLRNCGLDPDEWSGFAFGIGLDRLIMMSYGINDIRKLYSGEIVFND